MSVPSVALSQRPRPVAFAVSLIVAWLLLGLLALALRRGPIEEDLAHRAADAVRAIGAAGAEVRADGRTVILHGRFDSAEEAERARAAAAVSGVSSVRLADDVIVASVPARPLVVAVDGTDVSVSATVPDSASRAALLGAVADAGGGEITGTVAVDPEVAMPKVDALDEIIGVLASVPGERSVTVAGTSLVLSGTVPDEVSRDDLGARVLAAARVALPDATLDNQLSTDFATVDGTAAGGSEVSAGSAGSEVSATEARGALEAALAGMSLTFESGSAVLGESVRGGLDQVARALGPGALTVVVSGHTDSTGPLEFNRRLSLDRARAAAAYLVERGVPPERLRTVGNGPDRPVADNTTAAGRAANRRVEITPADD